LSSCRLLILKLDPQKVRFVPKSIRLEPIMFLFKANKEKKLWYKALTKFMGLLL
jgi:hypothetical protein